ncbi:hypothetical protein HKD37_01G000502 [Glycine soja]
MFFVVYKIKAKVVEHTKKRDTGHQSVSLDNKTGDSTMLKMGDSAKVVIKQDMKGRRHKYGFNNNEREKARKKRVVDDETVDKHQLDEIMGSPPASTTPPPPPPPPPPPFPPRPPPTSDASASTSAVKRTHKASRGHHLRELEGGPYCSEGPDLGGYSVRRKGSYYRPWGRDRGNLNQTSRGNGPLQPIRTVSRTLSVTNTTSARKSGPSFARLAETLLRRMCASRHKSSRSRILPLTFCLVGKLLAEKTKKKLQEVAQSGSVDGVIDPPSPIKRHVKWKMSRTKKTREMTTEAAKEIAEKIDSFEEQVTQGSFVPHGRQDVLAAAIGRPEHPGRVHAAGVGVTIKQYFGSAPRTSRSASSLPPDELQQLTQQIRDQLEESITEKVTRQVMASFSQLQSQMQSQAPPEPLVGPGPSGTWVSTKGSCVDPSGNDPETGDSDRCGLYIEADPARLVAVGRVYEGSTLVHNTPLLPGQVKVSVDEVKDVDAPVPVPTAEVSLVGQALHTFLAWPTHLIKSLSHQVAVSPPKPPPKPDPEVDNPLYLMTLTISELFLRPYQVRWDATVFGVVNPDFPLYIKHEDLSEIAHGGQCLSISVLQLWILHLTETCMRAGNSDIYGFLEPQSIQRSEQSQFESESYIKSWMQSSQRDVYLGAYLNGPDNYLKGIINRVLMMLHSLNQRLLLGGLSSRQKGTTECGYYVMHWMSTIILETFRNNWEAYFNDPRPLEPERLKALWIQWAQFYLRVRDQA